MDNVLNGFVLQNVDKLVRAIEGTVGAAGQLVGGVGENASNEAKIAEYDRLGGLILKGKNKVKMGSFYDFAAGQPRPEPIIEYVFRDLQGNEVIVPEGKEIPIEVKAVEVAKAAKIAKGKKVKKPKKSIEEDEE